MTTDDKASRSTAATRREQLRQLGHDIKSHLGVVTMGFAALEGAKGDPAEFAELYGIIQADGIQPLKQTVLEMVELACYEEEEEE